MTTRKPTIVIAFGTSSRATAAAGPVTSIKALTDCLADRYDFRILAEPTMGFPDQVATCRGWFQLIRYFRSTSHDLVMLSSFFDREYTMPILQLRKLELIPRKPTIVSPRGEFSPGALALKPRRKHAYFSLARRLGLLSDIWLHATGPREAEDILRTFPFCRGILVAPNVRVLRPLPRGCPARSEASRLVFLSRIDRKKNLDYAIKVLSAVRSPVQFDIFGPVTHQDYWDHCWQLIDKLPSHVKVRYLGVLPSEAVSETLADYDLFFLPTRGENFGHAIFDALEVGLPVLISDQTPWQKLDSREAGWSLPLDAPEAFAAAIERFAATAQEKRARLRQGARRLAEASVESDDAATAASDMFRDVLAHGCVIEC